MADDNLLEQALQQHRQSLAGSLPTTDVSTGAVYDNPLEQALQQRRQMMGANMHWEATAPTPPVPPWQRPPYVSLPMPAPEGTAVGEQPLRFFERRLEESVNPLEQALQQHRQTAGVYDNPLEQALQQHRQGLGVTAPAAEAPKADANVPWYERAWDWINKPLFEFNPENKGGFVGGVEDVASGFTSPLSIGLTFGTLGLGPALRLLDVGLKEVPVVVQGIRALIAGGLTVQQAHQVIQESPRVLDALREGDYDTAKRLAVHVVAGGIGAVLGAREAIEAGGDFAARKFKDRESFTPAGRAQLSLEVGKYQADNTSAAQEADAFVKAARKELGKEAKDSTTLGAISRYIEAGGDIDALNQRREALSKSKAVEDNYSAKERQLLLDKYEQATKLTPAQTVFADKIRGQLAWAKSKLSGHGVINSSVENYLTHVWQDEANAAVNKTRHQMDMGHFKPNTSLARERTFATSFEGEMLGRKLATDDPIALTANHTYQVRKVLAARNFLEHLRDMKASDGRPMTGLAGSGTPLEDATLVNPARARNVRIADADIQDLKQSGQFEDLLKKGIIEPHGKDAYAWHLGDYEVMNHPAFRDWNFASNDPEGNPVLVKADLRVHPEAAQFIERALGLDTSPIREYGLGRAALKVSREAKGSVLGGLSPFHVMQEGLRGVMSGINPFSVEHWNLDADPDLRSGVEAGLTLGKDHRGLSDFAEGMKSNKLLIEKLPLGIGKLQTKLHHWLFDTYIPSLKARAYRSLFERYQKSNPSWGVEKAASEAAADTNERFGGLNYAQLGRSAFSRDMAGLGFLAPDWLESEVRLMTRTFKPGAEGKIARTDMARIGLFTFAAARVLNMLTSGKPHLEAPFGVVVQDDKGRDISYSFRTPLSDLAHVLSDPKEFIKGRVNPLTVRTGIEAFTGRDKQGRRVPGGEQITDLVKNVLPISVQSELDKVRGRTPDMSTGQQIAKALGASVYQYKTQAEKLAIELASDRTETGPVTDDMLAKHRLRLQAEDDVRRYLIETSAGKSDANPPTLAAFSAHERKQIVEHARLSRLQGLVEKLPALDALQVYDRATPTEQQELKLVLRKKAKRLKERFHQMSPLEAEAAKPALLRLIAAASKE